MITLKVYGSSSKGNCYLLDNGVTKLMLDCGVKKIKDMELDKVDGILITHRHLDHCGGVKYIKDYYKGKYYSNKETLDILPVIEEYKEEIVAGEMFSIGTFNIVAFEVNHDVKNYGYLIKDTISNTKTIYITDTNYIKYQFKDIDYYIIEANYSYEWLREKEELDVKERRLFETHMAIEDTNEFLQNNTNHNTKKVILCHIARDCEDYLAMKDLIELNNKNIDIIPLNPNSKKMVEIVLKKDLEGFDFD